MRAGGTRTAANATTTVTSEQMVAAAAAAAARLHSEADSDCTGSSGTAGQSQTSVFPAAMTEELWHKTACTSTTSVTSYSSSGSTVLSGPCDSKTVSTATATQAPSDAFSPLVIPSADATDTSGHMMLISPETRGDAQQGDDCRSSSGAGVEAGAQPGYIAAIPTPNSSTIQVRVYSCACDVYSTMYIMCMWFAYFTGK